MAASGIHETEGIELEEHPAYKVIGGNMQVVNVRLEPGDKVSCEPGCLMHMDPSAGVHTSYACSCKKYCSGESQWSTQFTNPKSEAMVVGLTPNRPGKVVPIDLAQVAARGANGIYCKQGAWMASLGDISVSFGATCNPCRACFAGQGYVRCYIRGEGTAFLEGHGTVLTKELAPGEKLVVDQEAVLAWADTVELKVRMVGGCCTCCCAGEGLFNAVLDGGDKGGLVVLESMPFEKYQQALVNPVGLK